MPSFGAHWNAITAIGDITVVRWNALFNTDLKAWLNETIDTTFLGAGAVGSDRIDGEAMTLDDPSGGASEQVVTRQTKFSGTKALQFNMNVRWTRTAVSDADYTAQITDDVVAYTALTAGKQVTLPLAATAGAGWVILVKDESGGAGANNITIARAGSDTIQIGSTAPTGVTSVTIATNYGYRAFYSDGTSIWFECDAT
jgi:hypothetical protein